MGDSDDDVPVGAMIKRQKLEGGDSAAKPTTLGADAGLGSGTAPSSSSAAKSADQELPEWWNDETSIVVLMERRAKSIKEAALKKYEQQQKDQAAKESSKPPPKQKKEPGSSGGSSSAGEKGRPQGSNKAADFYETQKGQLLQALLVRWWYAFDWPTKKEIGVPPVGYEEMDGFPGVFVSFNLDSLGAILDLRDMTNCPSLKNLSKRTAKQIQDLAIEAITKQMTELQEAEGQDAPLCAELKKKLKIVKAINAEEAEREALKGGSKYVF